MEGSDSCVSPVLPLADRLAQLRPSAELLQFYRDKVAEYDNDQESMLARLESYRNAVEEQHSSHWKVQQKEEEVGALQKALSDLQVCLFQEREQVLRVHAENDKLKIRELEDRRKIQHLLSLTAAPSGASTTYFVAKPPLRSNLVTKHGSDKRLEEVKRGKELAPPVDRETLLLTIESLQCQLHDCRKLHKEQVETLYTDSETRQAEHSVVVEHLTQRTEHMAEQLKRTQDLLYDSTKDFLSLKYENRLAEKRWIEEKDHFLRELDKLKEDLDTTCSDLTVEMGEHALLGLTGRQVIVTTNKNLQTELDQANKLCDMYREQCIGLEEQVCILKEENDVSRSLFKERTTKMSKRLTTMNSRYESLESRRTLEIEGFKTDVQMLRKKVHDLEKQLFRVTLAEQESPDVAVLKHVKMTAQRSKKLLGDINNVKSKLYNVENHMRKNF